MRRRDSSVTGTGGVCSAGAGVLAGRQPMTDSVAVSAARKDTARPPYSGPRRGGVPKGLHPLKGLVAPNYVSTGVFLKPDLLDLLDPATWRHSHTKNCQDLRGAALCAMIVCCGATLCELPRIKCSNWLPGNRDEVELSGAGGLKNQPRTIPVLAFAKFVIDRYSRNVKRAPGVTHLFVDNEGMPTTACALMAQFKWMTRSNGLPVDSLINALHNAFERWAKTDEGPMMRALTGRRKRKWLAPDPAFSIDEKRKAIENVHPLGKTDREMLRWKGPYARRYPNPHFPALSREARTEYEFALKTRGGTTYGVELRDAVRAALDSGKLVSEVAAHYGMNVSYVQEARDGTIGKAAATMRNRRLQLSLLQWLQSGSPRHVEEVRRWAMTEHGIDLSQQNVRKLARKHGVKLIRPPPSWVLVHGEALLSRMQQEFAPSALEVKEWASKERHVDLTLRQICGLAAAHGVTLAHPLNAYKEALLAHAHAMPDKNAAQMATWLLGEKGVETTGEVLENFLVARGWTKPAKSILNGHTQAARDLVAGNPNITYREIQAWLADRGVNASTVSIIYAMKKAGIEKVSQSMSAKKARAAVRQ
jgi:hypothetical protein